MIRISRVSVVASSLFILDLAVLELTFFFSRLSQVSKSWLSLVFDGELWSTLSARSYANLPPLRNGPTTPSLSNLFLPSNVVSMATISVPTNTLHVIASHAGPFLRTLDLRNLTSLSSSTLHKLALAASSAPLESVRRSFEDGNGGQPGWLRMGLDQKEGVTRLTTLDLAGCRSFSGGALNHLLAKVSFLFPRRPSRLLVLTPSSYSSTSTESLPS